MIDENLQKYEPFFGKWKISRSLGRGSFGSVYEIYWEDGFGGRSLSALKYMHIPSREALEEQRAQQPNMEAVRNYFLKQVERIKDEIRILQKCKGHSNIVSYEDHLIEEHVGENEFGWDILIRMELLYPLSSVLNREQATQYDVVCLWRDIANALIYCEEQNIIHRDIKPANILVASTGQYKLSDFGVARKFMGRDTPASTRVGTEKYMAPEVYNNQKYDKTADYYSLGCVIYYFLNKNRHPFYPPYPKELEQEDVDRAEDRRLRKGEKVPAIVGVSREVNEVLQKSMAYNAAKRYRNAKELYRDIQKILDSQGGNLRQRYLSGTYTGKDRDGSSSASRRSSSTTSTTSSSVAVPVTVAAVLLVAGIGGMVYGVSMKNSGKKQQNSNLIEEKAASGQQELFITETQENQEVIAQVQTKQKETEVSKLELETESETERVTETESETEKVTETETESETERVTETESETERVTETETETERVTETETETEKVTETETETETERVTETETETEKVTETETESETERVTETETETEKVTETETETETERVTETETETETELPIPTTLLLGNLERPADGDTIEKNLKVKGWILSSDDVENDIAVYVDLKKNGETAASFALDVQEMGQNSFEKRQKKNAGEIVASKGYEIKGSASVEDIPDGTYQMDLRVVYKENKGGAEKLWNQISGQGGAEEILQTAEITIANKRSKNNEDLQQYMGITEDEVSELSTHYIYGDQGFAIGLDLDEDNPVISGNADQLLLTGWINAAEGTSLGMYLEVDSDIYTADTLAEQGGSVEIVRAPRYLENMDANLIGNSVLDMEEAGYIIALDLPFLNEGAHTVGISFNVGVPGNEPELVDMKQIAVTVDPSATVKKNAIEQIAKKWNVEFPKPIETESETETEL